MRSCGFGAVSVTKQKAQDIVEIYGKAQLTLMKTMGELRFCKNAAGQCEATLNVQYSILINEYLQL